MICWIEIGVIGNILEIIRGKTRVWHHFTKQFHFVTFKFQSVFIEKQNFFPFLSMQNGINLHKLFSFPKWRAWNREKRIQFPSSILTLYVQSVVLVFPHDKRAGLNKIKQSEILQHSASVHDYSANMSRLRAIIIMVDKGQIW